MTPQDRSWFINRTAVWMNARYPIGDRSVPWDEPCADCGQPAGEHFVNLNGRRDDKATFPRCPRDAHAEGPRHKGEPPPLPSQRPMNLSHDTLPGLEEKKGGMAPRKADMPPLDQLSIDQLDPSLFWVWMYGPKYSHAQGYSTEAEADAVAAKVGRDGDLKVLVLTPSTIQMAKSSPDRGQSLWDEIGAWFTAKGSLTVGSSGFGHDAWLGKFYPPATMQKDRIAHYAKSFMAVEITSTRHSAPPTRVLENWAASTPAGFVFSFCAPTHVRPSNMKVGAEIMRSFMRRIAAVGNKLGPVVLHIGPLEKYDDGDAKRFFDALPAHRYAVHVESHEWENQEVLDELLARNIAVVDTKLGRAVTDGLGWSYKRIASDLVVRLPSVVDKDNTSLVFVVDPTNQFPSKEMLDANRSLGRAMGPHGPLTLLPNSMGPGGGVPTGPSNSPAGSGTQVADGISLEPEQPNHKKVRRDFGRDVRNTEPMSIGDSENNSDGNSVPFEHSVDGKTGSSGSTTSF